MMESEINSKLLIGGETESFISTNLLPIKFFKGRRELELHWQNVSFKIRSTQPGKKGFLFLSQIFRKKDFNKCFWVRKTLWNSCNHGCFRYYFTIVNLNFTGSGKTTLLDTLSDRLQIPKNGVLKKTVFSVIKNKLK